MDTSPLQWIKPETAGISPTPRFSHTMVYHSSLNIVIIYGGLNDEYDYNYLSDISILNTESLHWIKVIQCGIPSTPRANHCAGIFGNFSFFLYKNQIIFIL